MHFPEHVKTRKFTTVRVHRSRFSGNDGKSWKGIRLTRWRADGKVRIDVEDGTFDTAEALVRGVCFCYTLEPDDEPEAERAQVCGRASCVERAAVRAMCGLCRRKGPLVEESRYR